MRTKDWKQAPLHTGYVEDIGYDEFSQRVYIEYGNGVKTSYRYDADRRWLKSIRTGIGVLSYQDTEYRFDGVGNVKGHTWTLPH
jgi:hypothetical protein